MRGGDEKMPAALATLIAEGREELDLDQIEFGKLFEPTISQTIVSRIEKGKACFPKKRLPQLARIIGVDLKKLRELHMAQEKEMLEERQLLETWRRDGWHGVRRLAEVRVAAL